MQVELPLFPGYVFVRIALAQRLCVLQLPSVFRFVSFGNCPAPLPEHEIELLSRGLLSELKAEPHPYLKIGRRVRIKAGPLEGAEGILLRKKGVLRVVLSVDLIMRSVVIEVEVADVEPIREKSVLQKSRNQTLAHTCGQDELDRFSQVLETRDSRGGKTL